MNIILAGNAVKSKKTESLKFQHFKILVNFTFLRTGSERIRNIEKMKRNTRNISKIIDFSCIYTFYQQFPVV